MENDLQTQILGFFARRSALFIRLFWIVYHFILGAIFYGTYLSLADVKHFLFFYDLGKKAGQLGFMLLGFIVLPGILGRFKIEIKVTRVITLFRRQLGIVFFLLAFFHYHFVRGLGLYQAKLTPFDGLLPFMVFGFMAFLIFFFMFLTSNNLSVRKLGPWWKVLHRFVYVALWALVAHTALQKVSVWTVFIGFFAVLEIVSWVYYFLNKPTAGTTSSSDSTTSQNQRQSSTNVGNPL